MPASEYFDPPFMYQQRNVIKKNNERSSYTKYRYLPFSLIGLPYKVQGQGHWLALPALHKREHGFEFPIDTHVYIYIYIYILNFIRKFTQIKEITQQIYKWLRVGVFTSTYWQQWRMRIYPVSFWETKGAKSCSKWRYHRIYFEGHRPLMAFDLRAGHMNCFPSYFDMLTEMYLFSANETR